MERLEDRGCSTGRSSTCRPSEELDGRRANHQGLSPHRSCATLMSYTKIVLERRGSRLDLPDDPVPGRPAGQLLPDAAASSATPTQMPRHRLHREIVTTVVVNDFVNKSGISCFHRLSVETGAGAGRRDPGPDRGPGDLRGRADLDAAIAALDHQIDGGVQTKLAAGGPDAGRAGHPLAGQQPTPADRHRRRGRAARRPGSVGLQDALPTLLERPRRRRRTQAARRATSAPGCPSDLAEADRGAAGRRTRR